MGAIKIQGGYRGVTYTPDRVHGMCEIQIQHCRQYCGNDAARGEKNMMTFLAMGVVLFFYSVPAAPGKLCPGFNLWQIRLCNMITPTLHDVDIAFEAQRLRIVALAAVAKVAIHYPMVILIQTLMLIGRPDWRMTGQNQVRCIALALQRSMAGNIRARSPASATTAPITAIVSRLMTIDGRSHRCQLTLVRA